MGRKKLRQYVLVEDTMLDYKDKTKKDKEATARLIKTKKETGICPDELWNLDSSIAVFIVPRLKLFIEQTIAYPGSLNSMEKWKRILRKILYSMKKIANGNIPFSEKEDKKFFEGMKLFGEYFLALWW